MTKPTLYIHAGVHRTGTTNLQNVFSHNRDVLRNQGLIYPLDTSNHQHIAWGLINPNKGVDISAIAKQIIQEVEDNNAHAALISGEDFALHKSYEWTQELFSDFFDIKFVVYLRRQDKWLTSWYNQHNRWPWDKKVRALSTTEFLDYSTNFHWIDYDKLLSRMEKVVGQDHIHVQTLGDGGVKDSLSDICEYLKINIDDLDILSQPNASLSPIKLEALKRIDLLELPGHKRSKLLKHAEKIHCRDMDNKECFTVDQRKEIIDSFSKSNTKVARRYFAKEELFDTNVSDVEPSKWLHDRSVHDIILTKIIRSIL